MFLNIIRTPHLSSPHLREERKKKRANPEGARGSACTLRGARRRGERWKPPPCIPATAGMFEDKPNHSSPTRPPTLNLPFWVQGLVEGLGGRRGRARRAGAGIDINSFYLFVFGWVRVPTLQFD